MGQSGNCMLLRPTLLPCDCLISIHDLIKGGRHAKRVEGGLLFLPMIT